VVPHIVCSSAHASLAPKCDSYWIKSGLSQVPMLRYIYTEGVSVLCHPRRLLFRSRPESFGVSFERNFICARKLKMSLCLKWEILLIMYWSPHKLPGKCGGRLSRDGRLVWMIPPFVLVNILPVRRAALNQLSIIHQHVAMLDCATSFRLSFLGGYDSQPNYE
jgi:hypothetical protein